MLKRFLPVIGALAVSAFAATAAQAATTTITPSVQPAGTSFIVSGNIFSGPISATFGHSGIPTGSFTDLYQFTIPQNGLGSGSVTTSVSLPGLNGATDLDFTSVLVNGIAATPFYSDASGNACTTPGTGSCGANEQFAIDSVNIVSGALNTITINGNSRGQGSYGGNATFVPFAAGVPEPATWALMILGFGGVGASLRASKKRTVKAAMA